MRQPPAGTTNGVKGLEPPLRAGMDEQEWEQAVTVGVHKFFVNLLLFHHEPEWFVLFKKKKKRVYALESI